MKNKECVKRALFML